MEFMQRAMMDVEIGGRMSIGSYVHDNDDKRSEDATGKKEDQKCPTASLGPFHLGLSHNPHQLLALSLRLCRLKVRRSGER